MLNKINLNKDIVLSLLICIIFTAFVVYITFYMLDIFNPIIIEDNNIGLTPQLEKLLIELEQKYR